MAKDRKGTPPNLQECKHCGETWEYFGRAGKCRECGSQRVIVRCNARKRKQAGRRCRQLVTSGRCYLHGKDSPAGHLSPRTIHGLYIEVLPDHLRDGMEVALNDPELLSMRTDLALLHQRQLDQLGRLGEKSSGKAVKEARQYLQAFLKALKAGADVESQASTLQALRTALAEAEEDERAWAELMTTIEQRRRLADSQARQVERLRTYLTYDQVLALTGQVGHLVREAIGDVVGAALGLVAKSKQKELASLASKAYGQFARRLEEAIGLRSGPVDHGPN